MDKLQRMIKGKIPGEPTGIEIRKSICTICDPQTQCGLDCYVKDGRIIKVEGSLENPQSVGTLCAKGAAQRQWVYHEDRLRTPLKRVGPRGSGEMKPISWTEALETVTENLQRFKAESGPESVVFYCGYPKQLRPFLQRLALQFGSPNYCTESSTCFTAMAMAWRLTYGQMGGPDLGRTKCLLVWTGNPFHARPFEAGRLFDARERGVKFIVVDPRLSPMAAIADVHLRLRPGTDGALALAMANVMISEGLYDREFVSAWTRGFDEFRAYAAGFTLEQAESITGVPAALIHEAAVLYATTKPAAVMTSAAPVVHHTNGVQNQRAVTALAGLTGNFDVPGGNVVQPGGWLEVSGAGFATREHEFAVPRRWADLPPRVGGERFPVWTEMVDQAQAMDLPRQLLTGQPYPLRGLVAFGMNHRMWPDPQGLLAALEKLDFICDVDPYLTDSAKYADIVLPACTSVERTEVRCYPQKYIIYTHPVIELLGESRSDTDIIFGLANKLGLDDPLLNPTGAPAQATQEAAAAAGGTVGDAAGGTGAPASQGEAGRGFLPNGAPDFGRVFDEAMDWILEPSGMKVAGLKEHPGGMPVPDPLPVVFKKYEKNGFPTPSGKMEFSSTLLEKYSDRPGIAGLPLYAEPRLSPVSSPEVAEEYPLVLGTGTRLPMFIHSRTFRLPWTRSLRRAPQADINPATARRLGIAQGDRVELSTPAGSIEVLANITELAHPETVHMYHDYPEADANSLLSSDYLDPISGFPGFKASLCTVKKVALRDQEVQP
ncbi:MAG: molybdopterin-dependent oxidoreductase [Actinomycetia bacterium]|nr:molybdopterin-dependent oxidoreductase [Actinomycetes bacterium]